MVQCVVMMGDELLKIKDQIDLWYSTGEVERICVGHGQCKRLGFTVIQGAMGAKNCIVVVTEFIFK
jgi:hypothetical protein